MPEADKTSPSEMLLPSRLLTNSVQLKPMSNLSNLPSAPQRRLPRMSLETRKRRNDSMTFFARSRMFMRSDHRFFWKMCPHSQQT